MLAQCMISHKLNYLGLTETLDEWRERRAVVMEFATTEECRMNSTESISGGNVEITKQTH